jgi:hypothetical protein
MAWCFGSLPFFILVDIVGVTSFSIRREIEREQDKKQEN